MLERDVGARRRSLEDACAAADEHLVVRIAPVQERLPEVTAQELDEPPPGLLRREVLGRRARRVVRRPAVAEIAADEHRPDGHARGAGAAAASRVAQRRAGQRLLLDELGDEPPRSSLGLHHADHLAGRDRLAGDDRQLARRRRRGGACTSFSIFIASTTQSTWPAATSSPSATSTASTVPCIGLTTASSPASRPRRRAPRSRRARASARPRRLGLDERDVEAAAVELDHARRARATARRRRPTARLPLSHATTPSPLRQLLRLDDAVRRSLRSTKHGCARSARWKPSSVVTPPISNSSSARSIRAPRVLAVAARARSASRPSGRRAARSPSPPRRPSRRERPAPPARGSA